MGTMLHGTCDVCGYAATLYVGGGLMDCRPETALQAAGQDVGLAAALDAGCSFSIMRQPALCPKCNKLIAAATVTYKTEDGRQHTVHAPCPDCGHPPMPYPPDADMVSCPVCQTMFRLEPAGHWD